MTRTVHLALYSTLADWEYGYAVAGINNPEFQKNPGSLAVATVGATRDPITTRGGLRITPDLTLDELRPHDSAMLILPGNDIWNTDAYTPFTDKARDFLEAAVPVAAICGATAPLPPPGSSTIAPIPVTRPNSSTKSATQAAPCTATSRQ